MQYNLIKKVINNLFLKL